MERAYIRAAVQMLWWQAASDCNQERQHAQCLAATLYSTTDACANVKMYIVAMPAMAVHTIAPLPCFS